MKRLLLLSLCLCLLTVSALSQNNLTGSQINDETAFELYAYALTEMSPNLMTAELTNNIGLNPADVSATEGALGTFNTQYGNAITSYNSAVNGVTDPATLNADYSTFFSLRVSATNSLISTLQTNLSTIGFAQLKSYVLTQKTNMALGADYYNNQPYTICPPTCRLLFSSVETRTINGTTNVAVQVTTSGYIGGTVTSTSAVYWKWFTNQDLKRERIYFGNVKLSCLQSR
jgi:hypothetical protein